MFAGGVNELFVVRVGSGGTQGTVSLKDNAGSGGVEVVKLTALYPGSRAFSISVKESLDDETLKER